MPSTPLNRRERRFALVAALAVCVLVAVVALNTSPTPTPTGPGTIRKLTDAPATCSVTEGTSPVCTVTISPAAPVGSSFLLTLAARTTGQGAWTPVDATGAPGGGTGADIFISGSATGVSATVNITAGVTSVVLPLTVTNDVFKEANETIVATLSNATGVTLGATSTTITIVDDDRTGLYDPVAYGATANNASDDDGTAITAALAAAAAGAGGGVVVFGTPGTYNVLGDGRNPIITFAQDKGITIVGYGATVKRKGSSACIGASGDSKCANRLFSNNETYNGTTDTAPNVIAGLTLDGDRQNLAGPWGLWESEQSHSFFVGGPDFPDTHARGRSVWYFEDITTRNSPGDGISLFTKVDVTAWDIRSTDDFRGGLVATGGNAKLRAKNWNTYSTDPKYKTGFDFELDGTGGTGVGGWTAGDVDMTFDSVVEDVILDGDLDIGSYLPDGYAECTNQNPSPGPVTVGTDDDNCWWFRGDDGNVYNSRQIFRNIQMQSGPTTISTARYHDLVQIENSTLVWGNNTGQDNRIVYGSGDSAHGVKFIDVHNIVDNSAGFLGYYGSTQGPIFQWRIYCGPPDGVFCTKATPANISFLRSDFVDTGAPNSCVRQANKVAGTHFVTKTNSTWTLDCGGTGSDGVIDTNTGSGVPNTSTTTTTLPGATTTTTTAAPTTTTTIPTAPTNRVQLEACSLGADVILTDGGTAAYGNNSVGGATTATCTVSNAGAAATYPMTIRYKTSGAFIRTVTVNGVAVPVSPGLTYPNSSGSYTTLINNVPLNAGSNTIVFELSYITLDYFEFEAVTATTTTTTTTTTIATTTTTSTIPPVLSGCVRTEAETGVSLTSWATGTAIAGASAGGYVGDTNFTGQASWNVVVATSGTYEILVRSLTGGSGANRLLQVGGVSQGTKFWPAMESWTWQSLGYVTLTAGANTVTLSASSDIQGGLYLDTVDSCLVSAATTTTTIPTTTTSTAAPTTTTTTTTPPTDCVPGGRWAASATASTGTASWITDSNRLSAWTARPPAQAVIDFGVSRQVSTVYVEWVTGRAARVFRISTRASTSSPWVVRTVVQTFSTATSNPCWSVTVGAKARQVRLEVLGAEFAATTKGVQVRELGAT